MTTTAQHIVTKNAWTLVASGSPSVTVQLVTPGPVKLHIGASEPAADDPGLILANSTDNVFSGNALAETDNVYIRGVDDDPETVTVVKT